MLLVFIRERFECTSGVASLLHAVAIYIACFVYCSSCKSIVFFNLNTLSE